MSNRNMPAINAIIDASSAIILFKAGLHELLVRTYNIVLSESVYGEITANPYVGSNEYKQFVAERQVRVLGKLQQQDRPGMAGLDAGEYDTIHLFYEGAGEFIITDDGQAARYCKKAGVPFINALLFPVILRIAQLKDEDFCHRAMEKIIESGRYSQEIIDYARNCHKESVAFALPLDPSA